MRMPSGGECHLTFNPRRPILDVDEVSMRGSESLRVAVLAAVEKERRDNKEQMISVRLPQAVYDRLRAIAKREKMGIASLARALIMAGLKVIED